jgi:hypothetical protein
VIHALRDQRGDPGDGQGRGEVEVTTARVRERKDGLAVVLVSRWYDAHRTMAGSHAADMR